jgi:hypothetical protein
MLIRLQKLQAKVGVKEEASAEAEELGVDLVERKRKDPKIKDKEVCVCILCLRLLLPSHLTPHTSLISPISEKPHY